MRILLFTSFFLFLTYLLTAQCTNTYQWPTQNVAASTFNDTVVISNSNYAGDYAIITDLQIGETYQFSSQFSGDYLTLRDIYDSSILIAHGSTPLTFTPSTVDQIALHINLSSPPCGAENLSRITAVLCTSCPDVPPMVGVSTTTPGASLDVNGEIRIGMTGRSPAAGTIRWNDTTSDFEGYNGTTWVSLTQSSQSGQWGTLPISDVHEDEQLIGSMGSAGDQCGWSVSIDGNYAIVGTPFSNEGSNTQQGAAYIYFNNGNTWIEQERITASDGDWEDSFGYAVSIDGDYAMIGAAGDGNFQGSAYIFHRTNGNWTQQAKLTANDGEALDYFGYSVSISESYAIVGAVFDNIGGNINQGSAYMYVREGSTWSQQAKLTSSDGAGGDYFGRAVSIDGEYAVVGSERATVGMVRTGAAYVFQQSGSTWSQQAKLIANDGEALDYFGYAVDISDNTVIIGAIGDDYDSNDQRGSAYIFERFINTWSQEAKLIIQDGGSDDYFGTTVSIRDDYAVVGLQNNPSGIVLSGDAYIFKKSGDNWNEKVKLSGSDEYGPQEFGSSVSISSSHIIVGSPGKTVGANVGQGAAYIFSKK